MSKRKRKQIRKTRPKRNFDLFRRSKVDLESTFAMADQLIGQNRANEAVTLLAPLVASHPRHAELHYYLGYAQVKAGDLWSGLSGYEQAMKLSRNSSYWVPLSSLYLELGLNAHALHALRQLSKTAYDDPMVAHAPMLISSLAEEVALMADQLQLSVPKMEQGLRLLEEGQRALQSGDYSASISTNRRAIKLLGDWPPPHNNLSQALFYTGQPEAAIAEAQQVLAQDSENLQALGNMVRFLVWGGQEAAARTYWQRLQPLTPQGIAETFKMVEAAALLEQDESVYQWLKPLDGAGDEFDAQPRMQFFLAVAEANLGKPAARRRLKRLQADLPRAGEFLSTLQAKRSGPGWANRFPYFHSTEIVSKSTMEAFVALTAQQERVPAKRFRKQLDNFVAGFPQLVLVAEKLIWQEQQVEAGISILEIIASPAAVAALRRFGLSQAGDDDLRMQVLTDLIQAGHINQAETLSVWQAGAWQDVQLRQLEVSDESEVYYAPEVAMLINQGTAAQQKNDDERAEQLFRRALALDPQAKEAYNNLGAIYSGRDDDAQAREMFQQAVAIDPTYLFPRVNLAFYLLAEDDLAGAKEMLAPLLERSQFTPQEISFYTYAQARILVEDKAYDEALKMLDIALEITPDYEPAQALKEHLETITPLLTGLDAWQQRRAEQNEARRTRLQAKLTTDSPRLAEALALYSKDVLTGMGRVVIPWGGWSALRKAELLQQIVAALQEADNLARIVADLSEEEKTALRQLLAVAGRLPWVDFEARFGSDLAESSYWQRHEPKTLMGRLRRHGLLVEATVAGELLVVIPLELRAGLSELLA